MKAYKGFNKDLTCRGFKYQREDVRKKQLVKEAINKIEVMLKCTNMWDFSKLED